MTAVCLQLLTPGNMLPYAGYYLLQPSIGTQRDFGWVVFKNSVMKEHQHFIEKEFIRAQKLLPEFRREHRSFACA